MPLVTGPLCLGILNSSDYPMLSRHRKCTPVMPLIWRQHDSYPWRGREVGCPRGECFTKLQLLGDQYIQLYGKAEELPKRCSLVKSGECTWGAWTCEGGDDTKEGNWKSYFNKPMVFKGVGEQCRRINQSHLLSFWECIYLCIYVGGYACGIQKSWTFGVILQVLSTLSVLRQSLCGLTKTCWVG